MGDYTTQIHEAIHGWIGNHVRLRCWEDFVLSEGTTTYLTARVLEAVAGSSVSTSTWQTYEANLDMLGMEPVNQVAWPQSCGKVDILKDELYSSIPYLKGALFYRAVEKKVGRKKLDSALQKFYERWSGMAAGMQDMLDMIREVTGYVAQQCATIGLVDPSPIKPETLCP